MELNTKIDGLYNNLSHHSINVLEYGENKYYPNNILNPRLTIISTGVKQYKKHILLSVLQKLKQNDNNVLKDININYVKKIMTESDIKKTFNKQLNKSTIQIQYGNNNIFHVENHTLYLFIKQTIIITNLVNVNSWEKQLLYNYNLSVLFIKGKETDYNGIDEYDVIIIPFDVINYFITIINVDNKEVLFNKLVIDDPKILKQNYIIKQSYNIYNCINIIIIDKKFTLDSLSKDEMDNYYNKLFNVNIKDFNSPFILKDNTINVTASTITVIQSNYNEVEVNNIIKIFNYYFDETLPYDFINIILNKTDNNEKNFILKMFYELNNINNEYFYLNSEINKIKNDIIDIDNTSLYSFNDKIKINEYNDYFISNIVISNLHKLIKNVNKKNYKKTNKKILSDHNDFIEIIDEASLFIELSMNKLHRYITSFKNKITQPIMNNTCSYCNNNLKNNFHTCCYCLICDVCFKQNIEVCKCCKSEFFDAVQINIKYFINEVYCNVTDNNIIINQSVKDKKTILLYVIKKSIIDDVYKLVLISSKEDYNNINNNLLLNNLNTTDVLTKRDKNVILHLLDSNIYSLDYDLFTDVIFFLNDTSYLRDKILNTSIKYRFKEINKFLNNDNKNFYYII